MLKKLDLGVLQLWPMVEKYTAEAGQRAISHLPGVDSHPKRIHLKLVFASKFDPRVDVGGADLKVCERSQVHTGLYAQAVQGSICSVMRS